MEQLSEIPFKFWMLVDGRAYLSLWGEISHSQYARELPAWIAEPGIFGFTAWRLLRDDEPRVNYWHEPK